MTFSHSSRKIQKKQNSKNLDVLLEYLLVNFFGMKSLGLGWLWKPIEFFWLEFRQTPPQPSFETLQKPDDLATPEEFIGEPEFDRSHSKRRTIKTPDGDDESPNPR